MDRDAIDSRKDSRVMRWFRRRIWNRGMAWTLAVIALLTALYYQFENWRSRTELASAHQRLIERVGTDDPLAYAPAQVPDEQNYFCIPVIQSWAVPDKYPNPFSAYQIPDLIPQDFIGPKIKAGDDEGFERMDLKGWVAKRAAARRPVLVGESPAALMDRELGDGGGILPQLASGLNRPYCCFKPSLRELMAKAGGNPFGRGYSSPGNVARFLDQLALHIRAAARGGNARKTRDTALIALRFGEGASSWGSVVDCLVAIAENQITFPALNDALACPVWDDASLTRIQRELAKIDDVQTVDHALGAETIDGYQKGLWMRNQTELA